MTTLKVWYCVERDELTLWRTGARVKKLFEVEYMKSKWRVTMIYVGEL